MNALSTTAAAVKTALAAASLGPEFKISRVYAVPEYDSSAMSNLQVLVMGLEEDPDLHGQNSNRAQSDDVYGVKVLIAKRVTAADVTSEAALAELDALSDFRKAAIQFLRDKNNRVMGNCVLDDLKNSPAYDPAVLDQKKVFVSVISLKYRTIE